MGKKEKSPLLLLVLISQLGITMLVAIGIGGLIGLKLSSLLHSELVFPVFLIIGSLAGFRSCYMFIRRFVSFENSDAPRKSALEDKKQERKDHA